MSSTLSVITLVKNRSTQLKNLLKGLESSTMMPDELIVVFMNEAIDHSIDSSCFPVQKVRLDDEHEAIPLAKARNLGASIATGEFLLFLDVDCIPGTDLLEDMLAFQQKYDALTMGDIRYLNRHWETDHFNETHLKKHSVAHPNRPKVTPKASILMNDYGYFWSLCFSISAKNFKRIGGFDECFINYGAEDTDFGFTARKLKIPFCIIGSPCYHQYHDVCRPPLNNFDSIVYNASVFKNKWNQWAMQKWLTAFSERGYIEWAEDQNDIQTLKYPTDEEVQAAKQVSAQGF